MFSFQPGWLLYIGDYYPVLCANDWSTLGSALLATDERMNDPSSGPPPTAGGTTIRSSGSTPSTGPLAPSVPSSDGHAPRVPKPPPFPPPQSSGQGGKGSHGKGSVESSQESGSEDEESDSAAIGHYKDPYSPISNIECHVRVSNVAHLLFVMIKGDVYCSKP